MRPAAALLIAAVLPAAAQAPPPTGCDSTESRALDFWLGDWELTYKGADGKPAKSRNRITKVMDGCVVLEEFTGAPGIKLNGHSVSTFDRDTRQWKQTWVDNMSSYLDFSGGPASDGKFVFARDAQREGKRFKQRMVFQDITPASLKWLWQRSDDGGNTWNTQWEIDYRRAP